MYCIMQYMASNKTATVTIRVTPEAKALLKERARREGRSVTNYILWLVKRDGEKGKGVSNRNAIVSG